MNNILQENINDTQIEKLISENTLLLEQLYVLQDKLEKDHYKYNKHILNNKILNDNLNNYLLQINNYIIENIRLKILVEHLQKSLYVEKQNNITSKLGKILINGVSSIKEFISLPFKLCKIWKDLVRTIPPSSLGGKNFQKVIDAYISGGMDSVEKLLDLACISPVMRANAYTSLARQLITTK